MAKRTCRPGRMKWNFFPAKWKTSFCKFWRVENGYQQKHTIRWGDLDPFDNNSMIQCSVFDLPPLSLGAEHETLVEMKIKSVAGNKNPPCLSSNTATCISTSGKPSSNPKPTQRSADFRIKCCRRWATFRACWSSQGKLQTLEFLLPLGRWVYFQEWNDNTTHWPFEFTCFCLLQIGVYIWYIHIEWMCMNVWSL